MRDLPVLLVLSTLACATARPAVSSAVAERELLEFERAWNDAELRRDAAALDAILDPRFVFTYGSEAPVNKATVLKSVLANVRPSPATDSEQHVVIDGDVAIMIGVETVNEAVDDKPSKKASRYTTTYVHRGGQWRVLSVHMVAIPPRRENDVDVAR